MRIAIASVAVAMLSWQSATALMHYQRLGVCNSKKLSVTTSGSSSWTMRLNPTSFEGTDMTITNYPMPVLRRVPMEPIVEFDDDLRQTAKEMMTIMYQAQGVGLAAPQVNLSKQLFVYNPSGDPKLTNFERVVCNPLIKDYSKETDVEQEACLSSYSDDCAGCVCRSCAIMVEYQNELGQKTMRRLSGFEARVFQHEYDHIQGILHFDRFHPQDRSKNQPILDKLVKLYKDGDAILDPDPIQFQNMQPKPITTGSMPPRIGKTNPEPTSTKKKAKPAKAKAGFGGGAGGFGGGGGANKPKKKKKK